MPSPARSLLGRLEELAQRPLPHFLLLCAFALTFYGYSISFGLIYDDLPLVHANHVRWLDQPWEFRAYYRPLQAFFFAPALVSSIPAVLHVQNIVVATLIVFLFGRVLLALGLGIRLVSLIEAVGVVLPTSMTIFVWICERTEWLPLGLGLALVLLTVRPAVRGSRYLAAFLGLSATALLSKESGVALLALAPLLLLARRRKGLALLVLVSGLALAAAYLALRSRIVDSSPFSSTVLRTPWTFVETILLGFLQVLLCSWLPVSFTHSWVSLAFGLIYGAAAFMGLAEMWRRNRPLAVVLLCLFVTFSGPGILVWEPRNLAMPGLAVGAFACYGGARLLESAEMRGGRITEIVLLTASLCSLASLTVFSSYALQDWIGPINGTLRAAHYAPKHGLIYHIDMYVPLQPDTSRSWPPLPPEMLP